MNFTQIKTQLKSHFKSEVGSKLIRTLDLPSLRFTDLLLLLGGLITLTAPISLLAATNGFNDDEQDYSDYDSIVRELSADSTRKIKAENQIRSRSRYQTSVEDPFNQVMFHGGLAYAYTFQTLQPQGGHQTFVAQPGFRASLGIDLLSDSLMAEGGFATFPEIEYYHAFVAIREFDLKILYKTNLAPKVEARLGAGLIARYLTYTSKQLQGQGEMQFYNRLDSEQFVTPSSNLSLGLYVALSPTISTGFDVSSRRAFITETIDQSSVDSSVKLDANF